MVLELLQSFKSRITIISQLLRTIIELLASSEQAKLLSYAYSTVLYDVGSPGLNLVGSNVVISLQRCDKGGNLLV